MRLECPHFLREVQVRLDNSQQFGADRREINGIFDFSLGEKVHYLLGDGDGHIDLGFVSRRAQMGSADYVAEGKELFILCRLFFENIEGGAGNFS